jgi:cytochrome c556
MRITSALVLVVFLLFAVGSATAQDPVFEPVANMGELMRDVIYPMSDAMFYVMRTPPETDYDWTLLRRSAMVLAESGNLLMLEGRSIRQDDWMAHAKELVDVGRVAFEATVAQDLDAIVELSPRLEQSCRACHEQYHPRYGRRRPNPDQ